MEKVTFIIDKNLDFKNHLIMEKVTEKAPVEPKVAEYYKKMREADDAGKFAIFEKESEKFYSDEMKPFRDILAHQVQELWDSLSDEYIKRMEKIHHNPFPFEKVSGVLTTAPFGYGYKFNETNPWFACIKDSPIKAVHTAMHEIMHAFFNKYFASEIEEKYKITEKQVWLISEALTVLLNLEFDDIRMIPDRGHPGHEELRNFIKESWLKNKDLDKVLEDVCLNYFKEGSEK